MPPPLSRADIPKERETLKIRTKVLVLNGPGGLPSMCAIEARDR